MYDVFDRLVDQFGNAVSRDTNILTKDKFQDFFDMCNRCFYDMSTKSNEKNKILKMILRMIGLVW
jgi:hypothetical protein